MRLGKLIEFGTDQRCFVDATGGSNDISEALTASASRSIDMQAPQVAPAPERINSNNRALHTIGREPDAAGRPTIKEVRSRFSAPFGLLLIEEGLFQHAAREYASAIGGG